jgi:hypothetical protein
MGLHAIEENIYKNSKDYVFVLIKGNEFNTYLGYNNVSTKKNSRSLIIKALSRKETSVIDSTYCIKNQISFLPLNAIAEGEFWPPEQSASILLYSEADWFLNNLVFMV